MDLTTESFLAAFHRFVSRRCLPSEMHSDNGTNFVGATRELKDLYHFLKSSSTPEILNSFCNSNRFSTLKGSPNLLDCGRLPFERQNIISVDSLVNSV